MDVTADATVKRKASGTTPADLLKRKKTGEDEPIGFEAELDGMMAGEPPEQSNQSIKRHIQSDGCLPKRLDCVDIHADTIIQLHLNCFAQRPSTTRRFWRAPPSRNSTKPPTPSSSSRLSLTTTPATTCTECLVCFVNRPFLLLIGAGVATGNVPIVRMFGVTEAGNSVA